MITLYHEINEVLSLTDEQLQYVTIVKAFNHVVRADKLFIQQIVQVSSGNQEENLDLSTLFLVNRLFTQACRMLIFSMKDVLLSHEKTIAFDKEIEP